MARKVALIIGITGQDGSYLAELLLNEGYEVHGVKRRASSYNQTRIDRAILAHPRSASFQLHYGDVLDFAGICSLLNKTRPTELYNLAAQSHVKVSFDVPLYTAQVDALGALNILEAVRSVGLTHQVRLYQASTSELYGKVVQIPQSESTPFYPRSPYAVSKLMAFWAFVNYREAYGMYACNGILFNHESPRRGETFVTRKITMAVAKIAKGQQKLVLLGNLDAKRDWGHAKDYVWCMWKMLQMDTPSDYVVATGQTTSVRTFCELAFSAVDIPVEWQGNGPAEVGKNKLTNEIIVKVDERYFRPTEVDILVGDPSKAARELGWDPHRTNLAALVREMVLADLEAL